MSVWKSDETLLSICILNFSFKNDFVWEEISNIRHSVSSPDETPRSSSKILRCASYFQLSPRCFIWWWNTAPHVWYITSHTRLEISQSKDDTDRRGRGVLFHTFSETLKRQGKQKVTRKLYSKVNKCREKVVFKKIFLERPNGRWTKIQYSSPAYSQLASLEDNA